MIADNELNKYTPLQRKGDDDSEVVTQYDMYNIENLGLLKVDLLGLRNQSLLELAVNIINDRYGGELDIDSIPMDDPETFKLVQRGETVGTFQLASPGMRALMRDLVPTRFEEIIALIALYRPGPLSSDMHKVFVEQKHGRKAVSYPHPSLEEVLKETYGVIVYQEQAMRISQVLSGYSGLEADQLRKAMAKKQEDKMAEHRDKFIGGACDRGVDKSVATRVFDLIEKFGGYGFNKSHSTAYAFVSYQTAYLKAHYPSEYMAALMTIYMDNQDRLVEYINECRRMGLEVRLPDINKSDGNFTPFDKYVLFGLSAVKNVGTAVVEQIIKARDEGEEFKSFIEFCDRVPASVTNKKTLESFIKAGAFDTIEADRSRLLATYDVAVSIAQRKRREKEEGQFSLFDDSNDVDDGLNGGLPDDYTEIPKRQLLTWEREMLRVFVSDHPLTDYRELLSGFTDIEISQISKDMDKAVLTIGGLITGLERRHNKAGKPWASFTLEDFSGSMDVLLFHHKYEKFADALSEDAIVLVKGRVDLKDSSRKLLADEVRLLPRNSMRPTHLVLKIDAAWFTEDRTSRVKEVLMQHPGELQVYFQLYENGEETTTVRLGDLYSVGTDSDVLGKLRALLGESAVALQYPEI